jgi:hypothetical protein
MTIDKLAYARNCSGLALCASFKDGAQRYTHGIKLWLPQDVSDITNLVSKASLVREREPLRIKSDSGDGRYKNSIRYPAWTLGARLGGQSSKCPRKEVCVFKISLAPAPDVLAAQASPPKTSRAIRPTALESVSWAAGLPASGELRPSRNRQAQRTVAISQGGVALSNERSVRCPSHPQEKPAGASALPFFLGCKRSGRLEASSAARFLQCIRQSMSQRTHARRSDRACCSVV